jgi:hypothetical protein
VLIGRLDELSLMEGDILVNAVMAELENLRLKKEEEANAVKPWSKTVGPLLTLLTPAGAEGARGRHA